MTRKSRRAIEQTALAEGVTRIEWTLNRRGKHELAMLHFADGRHIIMHISRSSRDDEYKLRGWTRQYIRNQSRQPVRS
jgi:hypothetical protein